MIRARRRLLIVAGIALGLAAVIFVLHDLMLFDADTFVRERENSMIEKVWADVAAGHPIPVDEAWTELVARAERAKWHEGEPPCFLYAPPRLEPAALRAIVDEMAATGALQPARATLAVWAAWALFDEQERHGAPRDEEILSLVVTGVGWRGRFLIALNREKVIAAVRRKLRRENLDWQRRMEAREAQFPPEDLRRAYDFWHAHRLSLPITALMSLRREMDARSKGQDSREE